MLSDDAAVQSLDPTRRKDVNIVEAMGGELSLMQQSPPGFLARFIGGQLRNSLMKETAFTGFYIDDAWLKSRKREAADGVPFVSTNDCVVSEFCTRLGCDVALMAINFRGKIDGCGADLVGNYEDLLAYPRPGGRLEAGRDGAVAAGHRWAGSSLRRRRDASADYPAGRRGVAATRLRMIRLVAAASPRRVCG